VPRTGFEGGANNSLINMIIFTISSMFLYGTKKLMSVFFTGCKRDVECRRK